jgi:hypothetical protein
MISELPAVVRQNVLRFWGKSMDEKRHAAGGTAAHQGGLYGRPAAPPGNPAPERNQARPSLRLLESKPLRKNTLRGFATIRLPNGLVIRDIVIGQVSDGRAWATLPSKPMINDDGVALRDDAGKIRYRPVNEWPTRELQDEFSKRVIALVREAHPQALNPVNWPATQPATLSGGWQGWPLGRPGDPPYRQNPS